MLKYDADLIATLPNLGSADVNQNGRVDSVDAAMILQYVAGLIRTLPPPHIAGGLWEGEISAPPHLDP